MIAQCKTIRYNYIVTLTRPRITSPRPKMFMSKANTIVRPYLAKLHYR